MEGECFAGTVDSVLLSYACHGLWRLVISSKEHQRDKGSVAQGEYHSSVETLPGAQFNEFLQISSGVSVAYFSSVAVFALSASQPPAANGVGDATTFFDSVVFLTMFLV